MTYKPALLHESKIYQEFQRLAAYLNTGAPSTGTSGMLSVKGTWFAFCDADTNNNGDTNVSAVPDWGGSEYSFGETVVQDSGFSFPETVSAGVIVVTFFAVVYSDSGAPFTYAGTGCSVDSPAAWPVNYQFNTLVCPVLYDNQTSYFTTTTPPLVVEAGATIQMNPFLNSGSAADKWSLSGDSFYHVVKLT